MVFNLVLNKLYVNGLDRFVKWKEFVKEYGIEVELKIEVDINGYMKGWSCRFEVEEEWVKICLWYYCRDIVERRWNERMFRMMVLRLLRESRKKRRVLWFISNKVRWVIER